MVKVNEWIYLSFKNNKKGESGGLFFIFYIDFNNGIKNILI